MGDFLSGFDSIGGAGGFSGSSSATSGNNDAAQSTGGIHFGNIDPDYTTLLLAGGVVLALVLMVRK